MKVLSAIHIALLVLGTTNTAGAQTATHDVKTRSAAVQGEGIPHSHSEQANSYATWSMLHEQIPSQSPLRDLPSLGSEPASVSGPEVTLADIERIALEKNPTLAQATAEIRAARGRRLQAGLYPNPVAGYSAEEIRAGNSRGGQQGFFVEQDIVLGGKLSLSRRVAEQEISLAELEAEEQRLRVIHAVRLAFYRVLAAQEMLATHRGLTDVATDAMQTAQRLRNVGQADETEVLQAGIELHEAQIATAREQNQFRAAWRSMAAIAGDPHMPVGALKGSLAEDLPVIDPQQTVEALLNRSPAAKIAEVNIGRAEAMLTRARREAIPNLQLRGGLQQNRELLDFTGKAAGLQGFAEIGVQIPVFNRNQGNVQAASATRERAQQEMRRVQLVLYDRASTVIESYNSARMTADRYRQEILPAARRAHELMLMRWAQMRLSYPQLLNAQRTLFSVQSGYVSALLDVWTSAIALEGFLLIDGLEAPARPGELDMPVREVNLPSAQAPLER